MNKKIYEHSNILIKKFKNIGTNEYRNLKIE